MSVIDALRDSPCPRPFNGRPDDFKAGACYDSGECGCQNGAALAAPLQDGVREKIESECCHEDALSVGVCPTFQALQQEIDDIRAKLAAAHNEENGKWGEIAKTTSGWSDRSWQAGRASGLAVALQIFDQVRIATEVRAFSQGASEPVQDTWLAGGPDLKAMSGSVESDRVIQLHFKRPATDQDRKWLLDAINAKIAADKQPVGVSVPVERAPEGYAIVPILPTPRMIEVGCDNNPTQWNDGTPDGFAADVANDVYVAMVRSVIKGDGRGGAA